MEKKYFKLRVKIGSTIVSSKGDYVVEEIPDIALELIQKGSLWLGFGSDAGEILEKLDEKTLKSLLHLRAEQGFEDDVKIIEKALKQVQGSERKKGK